MSTRRWRSVTSIALATAVALGWAAPAQAMTPRLITGPYVSGWFGYWEPDSVVQALADIRRLLMRAAVANAIRKAMTPGEMHGVLAAAGNEEGRS